MASLAEAGAAWGWDFALPVAGARSAGSWAVLRLDLVTPAEAGAAFSVSAARPAGVVAFTLAGAGLAVAATACLFATGVFLFAVEVSEDAASVLFAARAVDVFRAAEADLGDVPGVFRAAVAGLVGPVAASLVASAGPHVGRT